MYRTTAHHPVVLRLITILCAALLLAGCVGRNGLNLPWAPAHEAEESKLEHITTATFDERVLKCNDPVLVDFYAEWCGPCKKLTPLLEEFATEQSGRHPVRVVKVNVDENRELAKRYEVTGMPTLIMFVDGQIKSRSVGLVPKASLDAMARNLL